VRPAAGREADPPHRRTPLPGLAGALAVLILLALDVAAVPAVLPSVRVELGSSSSGVVWVQGAYMLALAVVLLLLSDLGVDRRALVASGVAAFVGGAWLASTADSTATLVMGRAVQGTGAAALLLPAVESVRPRAAGAGQPVALVAVAALFALAVAPLVGGAVAEHSSWRWLFRIELVGAVPALMLLAAGGRTSAAAQAFHGGRTATLAAGLILSVTGLIQSGPWGWSSADTLLLLAAGAGLLLYTWRGGMVAPEAAGFVVAGVAPAALLLAPQYLELVRGLSPLRSGVIALALTLPAATFALLARLASARLSARLPVAGGLAAAAAGALGTTRIDPASSYALIAVSLGLLGSGIGAAAGRLTVRGETAGHGAPTGGLAVRGEGRNLVAVAASGSTLLLAAAGAVLQRTQLDEREAGGSFEAALAAGAAASGWLMATLLAAAALLAWGRADY
jgi:MFS transporter, DHA2 family, multidrug resistance protein